MINLIKLARLAAMNEAQVKSASVLCLANAAFIRFMQKLAEEPYRTRANMAMPTDAQMQPSVMSQGSPASSFRMSLMGTGGRSGGIELGAPQAQPQPNTNYSMNLMIPNFTGTTSSAQAISDLNNQKQNAINSQNLNSTAVTQPIPVT